VSVYPKEIFRASERWLKKRYKNLAYYNVLDAGGHFAAFEKPEIFINEIRKYFTLFR
jgi:pimeloyl-ACP methyl ester carboxylesterase